MKREINTKFWTFDQNNSGGRFTFDKAGITHTVVIEAISADDACSRAEKIGIYFDGCRDGIDCSCCGDRWHRAYEEGDDEPMYYGTTPVKGREASPAWMGGKPETAIHYFDGSIEWLDEKGATTSIE